MVPLSLSLKSLALLPLLFLCSQALYPYAQEDGIINLGLPTIAQALQEFPAGLLIYYFEPFCYPCRHMWPELVAAAKELADVKGQVRIAKLNCHDEVDTCNQRGVTTFPTIQLNRLNFEPIEYRGPRTKDSMVSWLRKIVDLDIPVAPAKADLFHAFSIVLLVTDNAAHAKESYKWLWDEVGIYLIPDDMRSSLGSDENALLLGQNGYKVGIKRTANPDQIKQTVHTILSKGDVIRTMDAQLSAEMGRVDKGKWFLYFKTKEFSADSAETKAFEEAAAEARKLNLVVAYVNTRSDILGATLGGLFGVDEEDKVAIGILHKDGKYYKKYRLEKPATKDNAIALLKDFDGGKATRFYMSAPEPAQQKDVMELTGANFYDVVGDNTKHVFVLFYFPWCEWCVRLEPTWNALGYRARNTDNLIIAKLDVSENDVPGFEMAEFPVLILFPAVEAGKEKKFEVFNGDRNIKAIKKFLFEHAPELQHNDDL